MPSPNTRSERSSMIFFSSIRRHTRYWRDWSSDVCSSDLRALADKARTIRIPVHVVEKLNKIGRAERKLVTELGREPTAEEIAEVTGIEPEEVDSIKRSAQAPVSLEKPVGDEEESEFGQFIADERAESRSEEHTSELQSRQYL